MQSLTLPSHPGCTVPQAISALITADNTSSRGVSRQEDSRRHLSRLLLWLMVNQTSSFKLGLAFRTG